MKTLDVHCGFPPPANGDPKINVRKKGHPERKQILFTRPRYLKHSGDPDPERRIVGSRRYRAPWCTAQSKAVHLEHDAQTALAWKRQTTEQLEGRKT